MTHPDEECNKAQAKFLEDCDPKHRRFHELMFMVGNATYRYHQQAKEFEPTSTDWKEWLEGLDEPIKKEMESKGFDGCKGVLSFTRYVMEKNDVGLKSYLEANINKAELAEYRKLIAEE